jgi:hypothetical protein
VFLTRFRLISSCFLFLCTIVLYGPEHEGPVLQMMAVACTAAWTHPLRGDGLMVGRPVGKGKGSAWSSSGFCSDLHAQARRAEDFFYVC